MSSFNMPSLYSVPSYLCLAMTPHLYSVILLSVHNKKWDNASPRSTKFSQSLSKSIPPPILAKYERCRAAHANMMENMAYFIGAVLAGNIAGLPNAWMNKYLMWYFATRAVYLASYIQTTNQKVSAVRSMVYTGGILVLSYIYVRAGQALAGESGL